MSRLILVLLLLAVFALPASADVISGRVRIVRPDGVVDARGDGFVSLKVRKGGRELQRRATVREGRWAVDAPPDAELWLLTVRTEDGDGYPTDWGRWLPFPADGRLDLDVRIPRAFTLRAYAADGRTELDDVRVLRVQRRDARLPHPGEPGPKAVVVAGPTPSPIEVRVDGPEHFIYYVVGPGHAWARLDVDPFLGGVRTLRLEPGGALDVRLHQTGADRGRVFRVRRRTDHDLQLVAELKRYPSRIFLDGLPTGTYELTSEDPIRPANMPVYAKQTITITAGQTSGLELELSEEPVFDDVPAGGVLDVPAAWGPVEDLSLVLARVDPYGSHGRRFVVPGEDWSPVPGRPGAYRWALAAVPPGAYDVGLEPLALHVFREVHGNGNERLYVSVPPPREVALELLDEHTGLPAEARRLRWGCLEPDTSKSKIGGLDPIEVVGQRCDRALGEPEFRFVAPATTLRVLLDDPRYELAERLVPAELQEPLTWRVRRATGVRVRLHHDGVPLEWGGDARVLPVEPGGQVVETRWVDGWRQISVSRPGRYTVAIPHFPGYRPAQERIVELREGQLVELVVRLLR